MAVKTRSEPVRRRRRRTTEEVVKRPRGRGKKAPFGIRFIAFWHFIGLGLSAVSASAIIIAVTIGWKSLGWAPPSQILAMLPKHNASLTSSEMLAVWVLALKWIGGFIVEILIYCYLPKRMRFAYWLCVVEILFMTAVTACNILANPANPIGISRGRVGDFYSDLSVALIVLIAPLCALAYLLLPKVRKLYF